MKTNVLQGSERQIEREREGERERREREERGRETTRVSATIKAMCKHKLHSRRS